MLPKTKWFVNPYNMKMNVSIERLEGKLEAFEKALELAQAQLDLRHPRSLDYLVGDLEAEVEDLREELNKKSGAV